MADIDLKGTYFQLFGLEQGFSVDTAMLTSQFRKLQQQLHPDRYVSGSDAEKRWSMQAASFVNQGHETLRNDLSRGVYLLELNGINLDEETDTQMDPMFLMEQMELREALEMAEGAADTESALAKLRKQIKAAIGEQKASFELAFDKADLTGARTIARQWQFLEKLLIEAKRIEERLDA